jgi:hypothetical protein
MNKIRNPNFIGLEDLFFIFLGKFQKSYFIAQKKKFLFYIKQIPRFYTQKN